MLSYEVYRLIHFSSLFFLAILVTRSFYVRQSSLSKVVVGIFSLLIFVSGMGLMARIGVSHTEGWPLWIKLKMGLWFTLAALSAILPKRVTHRKNTSIFLIVFVIFLALMTAVYRHLLS